MSKKLDTADETYMRWALSLAERGAGRTSPNPMVGAVIVKAGRIVGEGYHRRAGGPHAEAVALKKAGARAKGATLYLNLEPCCHLDKRTPPCVPLIIRSRIKRIVIAMRDPNPKVNGKAIAILRRAGIQVTEGVLKHKALRLNEVYVKYITTGKPFVISKAAMSLDGKIAFKKGSSTWITGKKARFQAHRLRNQADAVLVGINTVLTDDPRLTTRLSGMRSRDAHRIVLDSTLKIPLTARLLTQTSKVKTIIATTRRAHPDKIRALERAGATVCTVKDRDGQVDLSELMTELGHRGIASVLIEGGGKINASAFRSGIVDKLIWLIAPKIIGDLNAVAVLEGSVGSDPNQPVLVRNLSITCVGEDVMLEGYL
ncbi:MAG: bifunctional diaminohydroxyphosphoribosylaminopyrimidine deaminase/5-amino-6-(5-phosphoribosylamino)uracil reductase RibD [Nitrospirae bacterium]|nr:bifunctional diaminohydroxyphosphoribosylaminopyrimidine deaminase/5-amino-6-(5-phosphoribosylamino)uracil reductase RibD [Nitrospirota bacterium]